MKRAFAVSALVLAAGLSGVAALGGFGHHANLPVANAVATAAVASADAKPFEIDAVHSAVIYRIKHLNVAWNYGRFNKMSGQFHLDAANPASSVLTISVDASSIDSGNTKRDDHLRGGDFFSAKEFPTLSFVGKTFTKKSDTTWEVAGDLTLLGVAKPLTITVEDTGRGPGRGGGEVAGIETKFEVKRSDFGMNYMVGKGLSDEVTLIVGLEGGR
ncbi:MAG: YceI family protein [Phycisphaerae bacterium]|jgi:polyisoprenoid-binding protein YceI